jgi:UDP-N-acetylmuramoylalanine--D-glutamate ligase
LLRPFLNEDAMDLEGQPVTVVGLARSGIAAAAFCARRGARVVAADRKPEGELPPEALKLREEGIRVEAGEHRLESFTGARLVVVSPGVPWDLPELEAARAVGVEVVAEVELGARFIRGPMAAVTGTKGKSTTTAALGAMLKEAGTDVRVGGNIGNAVTGLLDGATDETVFVLEVSSFQLEGTRKFHPKVALFTNLSPDHLDRHPSFEAYAAAKARVFANQTGDDFAVVNADDPGVMALARKGRARLVPFAAALQGDGAGFVGDEARLRHAGREETLFDRRRLRVPGVHLATDLLAAGTAARLLGASAEAVMRAAHAFKGIENVLEHVADVHGVAFYNDTKATNVDAAQKSIEAFTGPVLPILGGRFKGGSFADLRPALARRGKAVLAIGEARPLIVEALGDHLPVIECDSLEQAVFEAYKHAAPGDTVLLAPACASFDMFRDYVERGRAFKEAVQRLAERVARG